MTYEAMNNDEVTVIEATFEEAGELSSSTYLDDWRRQHAEKLRAKKYREAVYGELVHVLADASGVTELQAHVLFCKEIEMYAHRTRYIERNDNKEGWKEGVRLLNRLEKKYGEFVSNLSVVLVGDELNGSYNRIWCLSV